MIVECAFCGCDVEDEEESLFECPDCGMDGLCDSCVDDHDCDPASCVGYHDRPMTQETQAKYDAYMAREQYNVALAMMLAASRGCVDTAAEGVAAWKAVAHA